MIKARTNNLNKPEDGNYGKNFNYICKDHGVSTCFQPGFFDTLTGNFMAGDTIRCLKIVKERVSAMCDGIVLETKVNGNVRTVDFRATGDVVEFSETPFIEVEEEKIPDAPKYIKEDGTSKWNPGRKAYQVIVNGEVVYETPEKQLAQQIARGDQPVPVAA
tara:strand:+ start:113 stop:595 length:483 start_codon:yes stop_codon:yes gene_type:complete